MRWALRSGDLPLDFVGCGFLAHRTGCPQWQYLHFRRVARGSETRLESAWNRLIWGSSCAVCTRGNPSWIMLWWCCIRQLYGVKGFSGTGSEWNVLKAEGLSSANVAKHAPMIFLGEHHAKLVLVAWIFQPIKFSSLAMKAFAAPKKNACSQCAVIYLIYCFLSQPDERAAVMVSWAVCKNMSANEFSIFSFLCFHVSILKDVLFSKIVIKIHHYHSIQTNHECWLCYVYMLRIIE